MTTRDSAGIRARWTTVLLLASFRILPATMVPSSAAAAGPVGVIDLPQAARTHMVFLVGGDKLDPAPTGADKEAIETQERKLKALRRRLAKERSTLGQGERESLEREIQDESAALQALHARTTKTKFFNRLRWRSPDVFNPHLASRVQEYGRESGLALIVNKDDDFPIYRDSDHPGDVTGDRIDLTESFIEWLRRKDESLAEETLPPSGH